MIDSRLAIAATALTEIAEGADAELLRDLVPVLARGLVMAQREMLLYLLDTEPDWPWNQ
ncbi:hypothetical protein [Cyanobium sp. WAJ14-Wanaka]|uniref:hypothetical protein n=1 Tax=Cyanobium sp. WAJ14-Wanaka TaxID=2823725 RepID=UPI0020CC8F60|nr:hypothetical protein [Cyanobium sp. WAJ14-Wanaka]MCP9776209.1 hypothetical protein [Cyanobium sp. WAJ14-Wanaka]